MSDQSHPVELPTLRAEARKSVKHSFIILVFRVYALTVQLAVSLALARIFEAEGYGRWGLMLGIAQWGYTFFLAWNTIPLTRFGREEFLLGGTVRATFASRAILLLPSLALLTVVAALSADAIGRTTLSPSWVTALIMGYILAFLLSETTQYLLPAAGRADLTAPFLGLERTVLLGLLVLLYRGASLNPITALAAFAAAPALVNLPLFLRHRSLILPPRLERNNLRRYWRFSRPIIFTTPLGGIVAWIDLFIINHFGRLEEVGRYFLAYQIFSALGQIGLIISLIAGPFTILMVMRRRDDLSELLANRLSWFALGLGCGLILLVTPFAWLAFRHIQPDAALTMIRYWLLLAPAAGCGYMATLSANYYMAREFITPMVLIVGLGMIVNVLLGIALVPVLGPAGAALATTAGQISVFIAFSLHQRCLGLHARRVWLKLLVATLPSALLSLMLPFGIVALFSIGILGGLTVMAWVVFETRSLLRYQTTVAPAATAEVP